MYSYVYSTANYVLFINILSLWTDLYTNIDSLISDSTSLFNLFLFAGKLSIANLSGLEPPGPQFLALTVQKY